MTLKLLDLYNSAASQEWAMYDSDAASDSEMENSLVLAINKAICEIYFSHNFPFRERIHLIMTIPHIDEYDAPSGLIKQSVNGNYYVKCGSLNLDYISDFSGLSPCCGKPKGFYINNDKIIFYPTPHEKELIAIDYYTLVIGESSSGEELYSLKNASDILMIPPYLEEIAREAVITRTMLNSIASESDENYSAYKKQADKAYRLLVKYSNPALPEKKVLL